MTGIQILKAHSMNSVDAYQTNMYLNKLLCAKRLHNTKNGFVLAARRYAVELRRATKQTNYFSSSKGHEVIQCVFKSHGNLVFLLLVLL